MKSLSFAALFFVAAIFLSITFRHDSEFVVVILATILGFVVGKILEIKNDLKALREAFAKDWDQRQQLEQNENIQQTDTFEAQSDEITTVDVAEIDRPEQIAAEEVVSEVVREVVKREERPLKQTTIQTKIDESQTKRAALPENSGNLSHKITAYIKNYFTGGNLFVRIGIIILFFGVSFLLKYVSDRGLFPIEYRLMAVVAGAIFLLVVGWRLRHKNTTYALLLQGAGIGILYLDIYAAFSMYHLLTPLPAFSLLFVVSMLSAALAVLQDSKSLAVLGFSGGFLAPVLASSGSNNHIALFSYYAVLNVAIVAIAWFKAWRPLNLLGFVFTFIIGTAWGVFSYTDDKFSTTEPFLILFFLFYVLIAVLFAVRQPPKLKGYVDGTLLFGVPLAASALQYSLVKDFEYGVSLSTFAMGAFYLILAWFLWKRAGEGLRLLAEAFLALGVIFTSMAIPFALSPTQTAAAWAVEGLGLLWLGSRQQRLSVRLFGLLLQLGAGFFVFVRHEFSQNEPFINGSFISAMMMAIAGILSARLLSKPYVGRKNWEMVISPFLLVWGLLWLFGGFAHQIATHFGDKWLPTGLLILAAVCSIGFTLAAQRLKPEWKHAWYVASGLLAVMLLAALAQIANQNSIFNAGNTYHPSQLNGWIAWPLAFATFYYLLKNLEMHQVLTRLQTTFHTLSLLLLVALVTLEGSYHLDLRLSAGADWFNLWYAVPAILTLWLIIKAGFWPFKLPEDEDQLLTGQRLTGLVLVSFLMLWGLQALVSQGDPNPLPWIPLLNPLDITFGIVVVMLVKWWKTISQTLMDYSNQNKYFNKRVALISFGGLVFLWMNFTLFRIAHHWFDVPYTTHALYNSSLVQPAISILWAISGVILTVYSSRKNLRMLWIAGGVLLVLVVLKLFVIDLSELGNLARIISFLVVGALLTSIGYFAPLPERGPDNETENKPNNKAKDGSETGNEGENLNA